MRIFIGGPGDTSTEKQRLREICGAVKPTLEVITGDEETNVVDWKQLAPTNGNAQQAIFDQARFRDTDVYVFVFWHLFGSPPGGFSKWRSRREHGLDDEAPISADQEVPFESGTEAEIEAALEAIAKDGQQRKRLMIYWSKQPIPPDRIDIEQFRLLTDYFRERLGAKVLYYPVAGLAELEVKFHEHILLAAHSVAVLERRATHALHRLHEEYTRDASSGRAVKRYVARECEAMCRIIGSLGEQRHACFMRTTDLYDRILEMMERAICVDIVDQDFRRWNELINPDDRVYTLNYSEQIVLKTATRARQDDKFKLRRIFAVDRRRVDDLSQRRRLIRILEGLEQRIARENHVPLARQLETRVLVLGDTQLTFHGWPQLAPSMFNSITDSIKKMKDIVLCETPDHDARSPVRPCEDRQILLREDISFEEHKSAFETWGSISVDTLELQRVNRLFHDAWQVATPSSEAIDVLQKGQSA